TGVRALVEVPTAVEIVFGPGSLTAALSIHRVDLVALEERQVLRVALRVEGDADQGAAAAGSQNEVRGPRPGPRVTMPPRMERRKARRQPHVPDELHVVIQRVDRPPRAVLDDDPGASPER